jgi:hypothetical protein
MVARRCAPGTGRDRCAGCCRTCVEQTLLEDGRCVMCAKDDRAARPVGGAVCRRQGGGLTESESLACRDCGGPLPLNVSATLLTCLNSPRPGQMFCEGHVPARFRGPMAKVVDKFACSGCRRTVKVRDGESRPDRDCECGGMLVFAARQSR